MKNCKKMGYALIFLFSFCSVVAQNTQQTCQDLRSRFTPKVATTDNTDQHFYFLESKEEGRELNYVSPMRRIFLNHASDSFNNANWQNVIELLSMVGAHQDIIAITKLRNIYESKNNAASQTDIIADTFSLFDYASLLNMIDTCKVVMINEAHSRIQPRAFLLSILAQLRSKGFTHLAMETLNHTRHNEVSLNTGYYTCEPMFGEVVREAL